MTADVNIGEVAATVRGVTYEKLEARDSASAGYSPLLRATNIHDGALSFADLVYVPDAVVSERQRLRRGDIVLAASSGSISVVGKSALLRTSWPGTFGAFCYAVRPNPTWILPEYLAYFMRTSAYRGRVSALAAGVNINNLRREHIETIGLPYVGLRDQQRVVETLDLYISRLDAAVASLERVQAKLKAYRASVLKAAVEGRLVPTEAELARNEKRDYEPADVLLRRILAERRRRWEEAELAKLTAAGKPPNDDKWKSKYDEPAAPDTSELPDLPAGWCWVEVGQLTRTVRDGPHFSPDYSDAPDGIPFITGGHVRPGGVDFASAKRISPALHAELCRRVRPEVGDILYTKGGTTGIARVNTYERDFSVWVHVAVLKLVSELHPFYLQHALNSPFCYAQAQRHTHGVGNQDLGLTRMIHIALPLAPLAEQHRVVDEVDRRLSATDANDAIVSRAKARTARLRQSILKWAFEGKLVDQDPSDEPAEKLLARIRAERAAAVPAAKKPRRAKARR